MFNYFKQNRARKERAKALYEAAEAQARRPVFYIDYGVPDSVDGRFEMISLHCYILMRRLGAAGQQELAQTLFDIMFKTMDRSLREMGVGDLSVPKHMKRMMQGFNGRAAHYEEAIQKKDDAALCDALARNVYGTIEEPDEDNVKALMQYVKDSVKMESTEPVFARPEERKEKVA
jgi:cytochrome b pre-mRNA-processing protein 3